MARRFKSMGIGELEELFAKSKMDQAVLSQLEHELQYRSVPRAISLMNEVQAALYKAAPSTAPATARTMTTALMSPPADQPRLWDRDRSAQQTSPAALPLKASERPTAHPLPVPPAVNPAAPPLDAVSVEDAYKLFKATSGSSWESIEQARQLLVQKCHPDRLKAMALEKRSSALAEARRVNAACATLSRVRCAS